MEMGKTKLLGVAVLLISMIAMPVFAYEYFWQTEPKEIPGGIILQT